MLITPVPEPHGIYPLTLFDDISAESGIVMGWLVEGILDLNLISAALARVLNKWPVLAGRLERVSDNRKFKYQIKFPAGAYPEEYSAYTLTSTVSTAPVSEFFPLPLPVISNPPPASLFHHKSIPRSSTSWASRQHPLTCWHVTYFPQDEHTCVGVSFSHGLLDGTGISNLIHALEAEMLGCEWETPPPLYKGLNVNKVQESLDVALEQDLGSAKTGSGCASSTYKGVIPATAWMLILLVWWHVWQRWWHGARGKIIILPPRAYTALVNRTRKEMEAERKTNIRLSTGDILVAWFFKTIYTDGTPHSRTVHCSSMANLRSLFPESLKLYPHNFFLPLPYPIMSVGELQSTRLHDLAHSFAKARSPESLTRDVPISMYKTSLDALKDKNTVALVPLDINAQEILTVTNVSVARIVNIDWTGVGGKRTICRYKYGLSDGPMYMTNVLTIAGRTHDDGTVLDVVLNKRRLARLEAEVQELISSTK